MKALNSKNIFLLSIFCAVYFLMLFLRVFDNFDFALVGVVRELITIPLILVQLGVFCLSIYLIAVKKKQSKLMLFFACDTSGYCCYVFRKISIASNYF